MKQFLQMSGATLKLAFLIAAFTVSLMAIGQKVKVSGTVIDDEFDEGLIGVAIQIKGTTNGTVTDIQGNYELNVNPDDVLVFSYIGFRTQEILVGRQTEIDVVMKLDIATLDEVIVVGYGEVKKSDLTGAVSRISSDDIAEANANDAINALKGRMAGIQITEGSGAPGSGANIQIRGVNSINAGTSPLYVIDGIQIGTSDDISINPLIDIDPNDISSIEILKDASATSIYGARGANGVVLITTKQGKSGKGRISMTMSHGVTEIANRVDMMSNEEYLLYQDRYVIQRALEEGNNTPFVGTTLYAAALEAGLQDHPDFRPWIDKYTSQGYNTEFNLSASGGSDGGNYNISIGYNNQEGIVDNSGLERITSRFNINQDVTEKVKLNLNLSGSRVFIEGVEDQTNNGIFRRMLYTNPFLDLVNDPEKYLGFDVPISEEQYDLTDSLTRSRNSPSNFFLTEFAEDENFIVRGRLNLNYKINKHLTFSVAGNYNTRLRTRINSASPESRTAFDTNGEVRIRENKNSTWIAETKLAYNKTVAKKHRISAIAVGEIQRNYSDYTDIRNQGFGDFVSGANNFGSGSIFISEPFQSTTSSLASVLGRVNYTLKDKYTTTISSRLDASSKFPDGNKAALFSAVALAWNVHEETFMQPIKFISNLKIRTSIGQTGNQNIPVGASETTYERDLIATGDGVENDQATTVWVPSRLGNPDLVWEKHTTMDVGLELGLLENLVTIESGFFNKNVTDVLFERPLPAHTGYSSVYDNIGKIQSYGWEHSVNAIVVDKNEFTLSLNANASIIKSYVRELTNESDFLTGTRAEDWQYQFTKDQLIGNWTGYILDGVYSTPEELANAPEGTKRVGYGLYRYVDINGDGIVDDNDVVVIGNTMPFMTGGFGLSISWKQFDLYSFFQYSVGADIVNTNIGGNLVGNSNNNTLTTVINSNFSEANPLGEASDHFSSEDENSNANIEDGDFIRWANLSLGYNFPKSILDKLKLTSARLSIQANNLMVFTKYSWYDPEVNATAGQSGTFLPGFDNTVYPRNRMVQVSMNLGF